MIVLKVWIWKLLIQKKHRRNVTFYDKYSLGAKTELLLTPILGADSDVKYFLFH